LSQNHSIKAYALFIVSIFIMALGISLVTFAELGTTAITSPPYVLSLIFPISFGMLTMLANILYVVIQVVLLGKDFPKNQYMQLLVGPIIGFSIDFWSYFISQIATSVYIVQLLMVIVGCAVIAISIVIQLNANVMNSPAEGVVKAFSIKTKIEFSKGKVLFDVSLVILAIVISFIGLGTLYGVREGTVISALLTGPFVKMFQKFLNRPALKLTKE
jgi:uncharacterized protein